MANEINTNVSYKLSDANNSATKKKSNNMGKDEFFRLLSTQMKYQNPLEPLKDTEFVAQMAQFSSLEQLQNLYQQSSFSQALGLIGYNVKGYTDGVLFDGIAEKVYLEDGIPHILVGGQLYRVSDVLLVELPNKTQNPNQTQPGIDSKNPESDSTPE